MKIEFQSEVGSFLKAEFDNFLFDDAICISVGDFEGDRDSLAILSKKDALALANFIVQKYGGENG